MNPIFKLFVGANIGIFRATGGKLGGTMGGQPVVLLTTRGRKSGKPRTVPLMSFDDGAGHRVVVASAGGSPTHPAWYQNLVANPVVTVETRGRKYEARAELVEGSDRARLWKEVVAAQPRFAGYEQKAGGREIPLVVLKEAGGAS
jgi:deazaflavin-dependent oxidoreductase (nitroreductase family)